MVVKAMGWGWGGQWGLGDGGGGVGEWKVTWKMVMTSLGNPHSPLPDTAPPACTCVPHTRSLPALYMAACRHCLRAALPLLRTCLLPDARRSVARFATARTALLRCALRGRTATFTCLRLISVAITLAYTISFVGFIPRTTTTMPRYLPTFLYYLLLRDALAAVLALSRVFRSAPIFRLCAVERTGWLILKIFCSLPFGPYLFTQRSSSIHAAWVWRLPPRFLLWCLLPAAVPVHRQCRCRTFLFACTHRTTSARLDTHLLPPTYQPFWFLLCLLRTRTLLWRAQNTRTRRTHWFAALTYHHTPSRILVVSCVGSMVVGLWTFTTRAGLPLVRCTCLGSFTHSALWT